jgi:tetratricopeptide (TPR) repeat protein
LEGKYDEAILAYNRGIEINPDIGYLWTGKGNTLRLMNRLSEVETAYAKARDLGSPT